MYAGAELAFAKRVEPIYRFDQADVILSLDADIFQTSPGRVRYARDFAAGRQAVMGRSVTEIGFTPWKARQRSPAPAPTIATRCVQHRWKPLPVPWRTSWDCRWLGDQIADPGDWRHWIGEVARDLEAHAGTVSWSPGTISHLSFMHCLMPSMKLWVTRAGQWCIANPLWPIQRHQTESLHDLAGAMASGQVEVLLILGGNPVYNTPADVEFAAALQSVKFRVHLGLYDDETAALCHWQLPESHYLEAWGDARAYDGSITIQQPLIEPLYDTRTVLEVMDRCLARACSRTMIS